VKRNSRRRRRLCRSGMHHATLISRMWLVPSLPCADSNKGLVPAACLSRRILHFRVRTNSFQWYSLYANTQLPPPLLPTTYHPPLLLYWHLSPSRLSVYCQHLSVAHHRHVRQLLRQAEGTRHKTHCTTGESVQDRERKQHE